MKKQNVKDKIMFSLAKHSDLIIITYGLLMILASLSMIALLCVVFFKYMGWY